jgi:hypothetical protein
VQYLGLAGLQYLADDNFKVRIPVFPVQVSCQRINAKAYVDGRHIGPPIFMILREKDPHSPLRKHLEFLLR